MAKKNNTIKKFCAVKNCDNDYLKTPDKQFFPFPKDPKLKLQWLSISKPRTNLTLLPETFVCEDHFDLDNDVINYDVYEAFGGILELLPEAVPSLAKFGEAITRDVSDLDKFKRRLIRTVARLLLQEKRPEEEVWTCLEKETNYNCQVLWSRMRALTLKKLDRLFESNDNVSRIPRAARMSLTDWLLFDMVLVHQNIDVIKMEKLKENPKPLVDLVELVKNFEIEGKRDEDLAMAWSSATLIYNNLGHQCSPMLLQLRWYQLKRATRDQFYNYWFSYRGVIKRLSLAEPHTPSPLQVEIAKRYKTLVTLPFLEWEEMIEKGEVVLPDMLANKMGEMSEPVTKKTIKDDCTPDLEVIEPEIETIDLGVDSDSESDAKKSDTEPKPPVENVKVKEEPLDIDIDGPHIEEPRKQPWFDEALQYTAVEHDNLDKLAEDVDLIDDLAEEENELTLAIECTLKQQKESMLPQITCVYGNVDDSNGILSSIDASSATINNPTDIEEIENTEQNITAEFEGPCITIDVPENNDTIVVENTDTTISENIDAIVSTIVVENTDTTISENIDAIVSENDEVILSENTGKSGEINIIDLDEEDNQPDEIVLENKLPEVKAEIKTEVNQDDAQFTFGELSNDMNFADDGIAFVDDGIAYNDDYDSTNKTKIAEEKVSDDGEPKIDLKLLMLPITYTTRLDDMGLQYFQHIQDKQLIEIINKKSKPVIKTATPGSEVIQVDESISHEKSSFAIPDDQKVHPSSYLLQKPRTRTYNPIQLCKNPDFNTRLKRLTVGFLSSPRNRGLLKACKPLTIDLTKAFEYKLRDGTIYLKAKDSATLSKDKEVMSRQHVSVIPSAMPAQSLIDNTKAVEIFPSVSNYEPSKHCDNLNERKKVINLPDISEIRRINQTLLTAEVSPIQVQNNTPQLQVSIVSQPQIAKNLILEKRLPSDTVNSPPPSVIDITKYENIFRNVRPLQLKEKMISERYHDLLTSKHSRFGNKLPSYKPKQFKPRIPWLSKTGDSNTPGSANKGDEALLTIDTLNKMLFLFVNDNERGEGSSQTKPKVKKKKKAINQKTEVRPVASNTDDCPRKTKTPRFNIKSGDNDPRTKAKNLHEIDDELRSRSCCCWAQRKILHMMGIIKAAPLHDCDYPICKCCCKNLLDEYALNDQLQKKAELKRRWHFQKADATKIDQSKNQTNTPPAAENTIEIRDDSPEPKEDPRKKVKFLICVPKATVEFPKQKLETIPIRSKTPEVTVVSDSESPVTSADAAIQTTASGEKTDTVIDLEDSNDESSTGVKVDGPVTTESKRAEGSQVSTSGGTILQPALTLSKNVVLTMTKPIIQNTKAYPKDKLQRSTPTTFRKSTLQNMIDTCAAPSAQAVTKTRMLQPDANQLSLKPKLVKLAPARNTPPINIREKLVYLSSKQISPCATENPIILEKNKILLTTAKFPPNLYKFEEAKEVLKSSIKLPKGVSLVLLSDGTVSYAVSPNTKVKATDMAGVPGIVATVQKYIKTHTHIAPDPVAKIDIKLGNQVVNLADDDDTPIYAVTTDGISSTFAIEDQAAKDETSKISDITTDVGEAEIIHGNISEMSTTSVEISSIGIGENTDAAMNEKKSQESFPATSDEASQNSSATTEKTSNDDQQTIDKEHCQQSMPETATTFEEQPLEASQKSVEEITNDSKCQGKPKNILSDLMEMSGIFDEDVTAQPPAAPAPVAQEKAQPSAAPTPVVEETSQPLAAPSLIAQETTQPLPAPALAAQETRQLPAAPAPVAEETTHPRAAPAPVTQEITQLPAATAPVAQRTKQPPAAPAPVAQETYQPPAAPAPVAQETTPPPVAPAPVTQGTTLHANLPTMQPLTPLSIKGIVNDLSPITSLCELRYACLNNGLFFKLDFETRMLLPIKVNMKEQTFITQTALLKPTGPPTGQVKSVIDLTEDEDPPPENVVPKMKGTQIRITSGPAILSGKISKSAKPVKIIKLISPTKVRINSDMKNEDSGSDPRSILRKYSRKQCLNENVLLFDKDSIKLKKNTIVSNQLLNINNPAKTIIMSTTTNEDRIVTVRELDRPQANDSDSSDEEPLAKKAKRKRANIDSPAIENKTVPDIAAEQVDADGPVDENGPIDENESFDENIPMHVDDAPEMETEFEIFATDENDEDCEENCILGF